MTLLTRLSSGWKAWVLLALLTFSAAMPGVLSVPALDRDESRFAQASKQMLESGDYIRIRYQDEGRNKKPAGIHWLQAASTAALGGADQQQIWTYRVPSLLGAILATLATFWCGILLVGRRAAFLGAALFGVGVLLTSEAHIAKTDGVLVGLTALTMGALARLYMARDGDNPRRMSALFWGAMGAAFLIKGPVTMLVAGLAILVICAVRRDLTWAKVLFNWRGLLLFGLLVAPWFIWVQIATSGAFLDGAIGKDLKDKLVGASEGHGGLPGYHLAFMLTHFFPATLFVVPSMVLLVRTLRGRALDMLAAERQGLIFLAAWLVPTWIFFECLPTKLSHYILPAYPALALICGWGVVQLMGGARLAISRGLSLVLFLAGGLLLCLLLTPLGIGVLQNEAAGDFRHIADAPDVLAQWARQSDRSLLSFGFLIAGALAVLVAGVCLMGRQYGSAVCLGIAASLLVGWHARLIFLPGEVWMQPTLTARAVLAEMCGLPEDMASCDLPAPARVQAVGYAEPSLVFTTGTRTVIPPDTVVALPKTEAGYPLVYLLNLEDQAGRTAQAELDGLASAAGRTVQVSDLRFVLNYSNGDPVAFMAMRID